MLARRLVYRATGILIALLLIAVFAAVMLARPLLIYIANGYLESSGLSIDQIDGLQIDSGALQIERITLNSINSLQENAIEGLSVTYSLPDLLKRRVQDVYIKSISIDSSFLNRGESTSQQDEPTASAAFASAIGIRTIPLDSLTVDKIDLPPYLSGAALSLSKNTREIQATLISADHTASIKSNWHNENFTSSYFIDESLLDFQDFSLPLMSGSITLNYRNIPAGQINFTLHELSGPLSANIEAQLDLGHLNEALSSLSLWPAEDYQVTGDAQLAVNISVHENQQEPAFVAIDGSSQVNGTLTDSNSSSVTLLPGSNQNLTFQGNIGSATSSLSFWANDLQLELSVAYDGSPAQIEVHIDEFALRCEEPVTCSGALTSQATTNAISGEGAVITNAQLNSNATFTLAGSALNLSIGAATALSIEKVDYDDATMTDAELSVLKPIHIDIDDWQVVNADAGHLRLSVPDLMLDNTHTSATLELDQIKTSISINNLMTSTFSATTTLSRFSSSAMSLPSPTASASVDFDSQRLSLKGDMFIGGFPVAYIEASHSITMEQGDASIELTPLDLSFPSPTMDWLISQLPLPGDLATGRIEGSTQLHWKIQEQQITYTGPIELTFEQVSGYFDETTFIDLSTAINVQLSTGPNFRSERPLPLSVGRIDPGFVVSDIQFDYQINTLDTTLSFENVSASIFGGKVSTPAAHYNWSTEDGDAVLNLEQIDLAEILRSGAYEGVKATGLLSGKAPLKISPKGITITNGSMLAEDPGGIIRYSGIGGPSSNQSLQLVNQALSNYHYKVMDTTMDYDQSGELQLSVKLQGLNPDMNQGQRINLNLNITDNIPALLESLQSGRTITDALERQINIR